MSLEPPSPAVRQPRHFECHANGRHTTNSKPPDTISHANPDTQHRPPVVRAACAPLGRSTSSPACSMGSFEHPVRGHRLLGGSREPGRYGGAATDGPDQPRPGGGDGATRTGPGEGPLLLCWRYREDSRSDHHDGEASLSLVPLISIASVCVFLDAGLPLTGEPRLQVPGSLSVNPRVGASERASIVQGGYS